MNIFADCTLYEGSQESVQPFWISREPLIWPWCNLVASQRGTYCASVDDLSTVGLVNRLWPSHSQWPSEEISFITTIRLPNLQLSCRLFLAKHYITKVSQPPYSPDLSSCDFWLFPKQKSPLKGGDLWMRRSHSTQDHSMVSHCRMTGPTGGWLFTDAL